MQGLIQERVYVSNVGSDQNIGDSLNPLASFSQAFTKLNELTLTQSGDVYAEIVIYAGTYGQALTQGLAQYQIGTKKLNVSARGIGQVKLDGIMVSNLSSGGGMIHLLGSKIAVRNIEILYSPANGVRFGYDYNGIEVNSQDILVEDVIVSSTLGHGILVGKGALNTVNPLSLTPMAERFLIQRCEVKNAVNYNIPQSQWGSAIKAWNAKHVTIRDCIVHDNAGEGIDFDFCDSVAVYRNSLKDNYANVYFDKVSNGWIYANFIQNESKKSAGILCAIEAFTGLITTHVIQDIRIFNNILLNTQGIHFWQGNYGANQQGNFHNIAVTHNTVIGHQTGSGSCLHFNYQTFLGQPVPNISFQNITISRNIVSAAQDSLSNGQLCAASLSPQVGLTAEFNLYNLTQVPWYNSTNDLILAQFPTYANSLNELIPSTTNGMFAWNVPTGNILVDYLNVTRQIPATNAGALEYQGDLGWPVEETEKWVIFPNPCMGELHVPAHLVGTWIEIIRMDGSEANKVQIDPLGKLDLMEFTNGAYLLKTSKEEIQFLLIQH